MDEATRPSRRPGLLAAWALAHDCHDSNAVLLYSRARGMVYGLVFEAGRRRAVIGEPPAVVAAELERLWRAEWRQNW